MSEFLKCDNEACGIRHDVGTITEGMIGMPCPECGSDMLTQDDWDFYKTSIRPMMHLSVALGLSRPADADTPPEMRMSVNSHNGEIRISLPSPTQARSE